MDFSSCSSFCEPTRRAFSRLGRKDFAKSFSPIPGVFATFNHQHVRSSSYRSTSIATPCLATMGSPWKTGVHGPGIGRRKFLVICVSSQFLSVWILYAVIGAAPAAGGSISGSSRFPILLFLTFVEPFVIEPMFLPIRAARAKDPQLVTQIERVVQRAGLSYPAGRMFWMKASDKTPTMNAYVSGIGASKRIVVWDTTIAKETTAGIVCGRRTRDGTLRSRPRLERDAAEHRRIFRASLFWDFAALAGCCARLGRALGNPRPCTIGLRFPRCC